VGRQALAALCGLALLAAVGLASGCGSGSAQSAEEQFRAGAQQGADELGQKYGMSPEALDCVVEQVVEGGGKLDLSSLSDEELDADVAKLGKAAAATCVGKPGLTLMVAHPTEAQAAALLHLTAEDLTSGFVEGGLPKPVAACASARLRSTASPTEIASLLNGGDVGRIVHDAVAGCV
jgi:hypothetical protein